MFFSSKLNKFENLRHCFFSRKNGVSEGYYKSLNCGMGSNDKKKNVLKNLEIVCEKIECKKDSLITLNQRHTNKVIHFKNKISVKNKLTADAIVSEVKNIGISILTADCAPIFIFDPIKKIIAVAHTGWRGAYKKILIKIIKKLIILGSKKENIITAIGPCIAQQNYEVKQNFKTKFLKQAKKNKKYFKIIKKKIYFSLRDYIKGQLKDLGIINIEIIKKNTYNRKNNFYSFRRSKKNNHDYGRNISVIMIK